MNQGGEILRERHWRCSAAIGWYYYLENRIHFPFKAICNEKRAISPLNINDEVDVIGMAPEEECEREMFIMVRCKGDTFAVPLSQFAPIMESAAETLEAVEDTFMTMFPQDKGKVYFSASRSILR